MTKRMGTDGVERDLDEHYENTSDVSEDPTGARDAIQVLWAERVRLLNEMSHIKANYYLQPKPVMHSGQLYRLPREDK